MQRVLIIRLSSMGDVILVTSLLSLLGRRNPAPSVSLVTDEQYVGFFRSDPRLDRVYGVVKSREHELQLPQSWDSIIDLQNNARSRSIRSTLRSGQVGIIDKLHFKRMLLLACRIDTYRKDDHICMRYARSAGAEIDDLRNLSSPHIRATLTGKDFRALLPDEKRPVLALFPFAAWKNKEWPLERFALVAGHFTAQGWSVLVFGSRADRDRAIRLCGSVGSGCCSLAGELTLEETVAVLKQCRLALGGDTGLSHLARACGVKTALLFGPTTRSLGFFPFGDPPFRVFEAPKICRPCHPHGGNLCVRVTRPCLGSVSVEKVVFGLHDLDREAVLTSNL